MENISNHGSSDLKFFRSRKYWRKCLYIWWLWFSRARIFRNLVKLDGFGENLGSPFTKFPHYDLILPIKDRVWYFDTENDNISVIGFLNIGRMNFRSHRIEQNVYLIGGFGENEIEKYDLETNHSTQMTSKTEFILYPEVVARKYYNC